MIVYIRQKQLKRYGEIYKEEVKEKRYYLVDKITQTSKQLVISYLGQELYNSTEPVKLKDYYNLNEIVSYDVVQ